MSKPKMSKVDNAPMVAEKPDSLVTIEATALPSGTINFRQMAEDAAKMQAYIANGDKKSESSGVKFIKPSGLFNSRVGLG